mmetsp:Transcript_24885/g.36517  ORF Transcript_24885/g.36517 Transcript_24885/m.36517 type:complete len:105 (-) Transcript_24885:103-417(-)
MVSMNVARWSLTLRPWIGGTPPTTTRAGSPAQCASTTLSCVVEAPHGLRAVLLAFSAAAFLEIDLLAKGPRDSQTFAAEHRARLSNDITDGSQSVVVADGRTFQ